MDLNNFCQCFLDLSRGHARGPCSAIFAAVLIWNFAILIGFLSFPLAQGPCQGTLFLLSVYRPHLDPTASANRPAVLPPCPSVCQFFTPFLTETETLYGTWRLRFKSHK